MKDFEVFVFRKGQTPLPVRTIRAESKKEVEEFLMKDWNCRIKKGKMQTYNDEVRMWSNVEVRTFEGNPEYMETFGWKLTSGKLEPLRDLS